MHLPGTIQRPRYDQLLIELREAIDRTAPDILRDWALSSAKRLGQVTLRRGKSLGVALARLATYLIKESAALAGAAIGGRFRSHAASRAKAATHGVKDIIGAFINLAHRTAQCLIDDPKQNAPRVFGGVLGFLVGSGGADGDGGIPDTDLLLGIENHRSIFAHSVLPGIIVETAVLSTLELVEMVYRNLPTDHDPLWDVLVAGSAELAEGLHKGVSFGIAYHLGVDATVDGLGTYKDLPVSLPIEGHQTIAAAGAITEAADAKARPSHRANAGEGRWFATWQEASTFVATRTGYVIRRSESGGFTVSETKR
jgi:hypothetical protein